MTLDLVARIGGFTRGMTEAERIADQKSRDIARKNRQRAKEVETAWKNATGLIAGAFAGISIANVFQTFIRESIEAQNEQAQLAAVLKSTGQAAGFTADQLNKMAAEMAGRSIFSEGDINKAQTRLLSYTGIVGEQFPQAMQAVIDMAARMGMSVEQSAETIGRALDIPSQGLTALQRQGFRFTEEQKKAVEQLEKTGRVAEAQAIVLDALKLSYGGAAEAARNTFGGAVTALQEQLRTLMTGSDGSLNELTGSINDLTRTLSSPEVVQAFNTLGTLIADTIGLLVKGAAAFIEFGKAIGTGLAIRINGPDDPLGIVQEKIRVINAEITSLEGLLNRPKTGLPISKEELTEITSRLSAARKELEQLRKAEAGVSAGFTPGVSPGRSTPSGVTAPSAAEQAALAAAAKLREERDRGAKEAVRQAQSYLENLQKQLQATEELSVAETVLRDIQTGRVKLAGGVTEEALLTVARQIDANKALAASEAEVQKAREAIAQMVERDQSAAIAEVEALVRGNDALREEIELLGLEGEARSAVEQARISSAIALKQEELITAQNNSADAVKIQSLEREIRLLQQRAELLQQRTGIQAAMKEVDELNKRREQAMQNIQDAIGSTLTGIAEGNFKSIGDSFTRLIQRMVIEAAAADIMNHLFGSLGQNGKRSGGVLGGLSESIFGWFLGSGKAAGGVVLPGGVYPVNEKGQESLSSEPVTFVLQPRRSRLLPT